MEETVGVKIEVPINEKQRPVVNPHVRYNRRVDSLLIFFYGPPVPATNLPVPGQPIYIMVDPDTSEVVGIHIEAFRHRFIEDHPYYKEIPVIKNLLAASGDIESEDGQWRAVAQRFYGGLMLDHGATAAQ